MGIKPCPVNGDECTRGLVPQECHSQSEKHKPSSHVREHVVCRKNVDWYYDAFHYCGNG